MPPCSRSRRLALSPGISDMHSFVAGNIRRARVWMNPLGDSPHAPDHSPSEAVGEATEKFLFQRGSPARIQRPRTVEVDGSGPSREFVPSHTAPMRDTSRGAGECQDSRHIPSGGQPIRPAHPGSSVQACRQGHYRGAVRVRGGQDRGAPAGWSVRIRRLSRRTHRRRKNRYRGTVGAGDRPQHGPQRRTPVGPAEKI